ncbi:MAG: hypothetical protein WC271_04240 [Bacteroidales bacterium]|nr:hypothetical protein [Bacteroidales bacterium]MDD3131580.1 hypothetical protein [Bacteroidales bacterium]NCU36473.1 hypothetical protein [Candidatus Falkowbacteria bacterium]NLO51176.1 hypothetical protein [Bacteroidales bacterium]
MTEIKIEKKKPVWPWILLAAVIVVLIIWWIAANNNDDRLITDETTWVEEDTIMNHRNEPIGDVKTYVMMWDENTMGSLALDHVLTNNALTRLINAVKAQAEIDGYDVNADLDQAQEHADFVMRDPYETTHADHIRMAAESISTALLNIQKANYPNLEQEAKKVQDDAQNIKPGVLTLDQQQEVKRFFKDAADLLDKMNNE